MSELVLANKDDIVAIADAIRSKTGQTGGLALSEMDDAVNGISGGSGDGSSFETVGVSVLGEAGSSIYYIGTENGVMQAKEILLSGSMIWGSASFEVVRGTLFLHITNANNSSESDFDGEELSPLYSDEEKGIYLYQAP